VKFLPYTIQTSRKVLKQLEKLPLHVKRRFEEILKILKNYPVPIFKYDVKKMKGYENVYRVRIGEYRLIYHVKGKKIHLLGISHRKKAYK